MKIKGYEKKGNKIYSVIQKKTGKMTVTMKSLIKKERGIMISCDDCGKSKKHKIKWNKDKLESNCKCGYKTVLKKRGINGLPKTI